MTTPMFEASTLGELLGEVAKAHPDQVAYVEGDERITFADWIACADSLAAALTARGVGPGDVVAIQLPSSVDFAVVYAAAMRMGAVATGINPRLGPTEITGILDRGRPTVLVHDGATDPVPSGAATPGRRDGARRDAPARRER